MGYKIFDFILIVNNWINHTTHININIPKSGCIINIIEIKERQKRFIIREKSSFILYRTNNRELKIINVGLANSDGWIEKYMKLSHLVAPFVSWEIMSAIKHKIIDKENIDSDFFLHYLTTCLIPCMGKFAKGEENSIIIGNNNRTKFFFLSSS